MKRIWNMAITGTGNIASKMAETIRGLDETAAYAVASRDPDRAAAFARQWGFQTCYGSYEEMARDPNIDLVYIATPHAMHYDNARLFLEHGKHVLVEKAFTANAAQAKTLIDLSREHHVLLAEAMWTRYMPGVSMIRSLIRGGTIGRVDSVEADFSVPISHIRRLRDPSLAGGTLLDLGIYPLTFASLFLGDEICSTQSRCIRYETGVDATDHIILTYRDGTQAFLRTSMVSGPKNEGRINGTDGYLEVKNLNSLETILRYDASGKLLETLVPPVQINGFEYEVRSCLKAIGSGQRECEEMPHAKILSMMEQMDGLRRSWGIVYPFESEAL